jgi:8-oxo-dGTP diphosphatase
MSEENKLKRPKVCVGVIIFKNDQVLLGKRRKTASHGQDEYSFPGGKIENEESFVEAVKRETFEEAGIKIKNIEFLSVINTAKYKEHQAVLVSFRSDWESGEPFSPPEENIGEWAWYDLNNLPKPLFYPTATIIDSYKTGKNFYDKE